MGTSLEVDDTNINLYGDGSLIGTAFVESGIWTVSGLSSLTNGTVITATAKAYHKTISELSQSVVVIN